MKTIIASGPVIIEDNKVLLNKHGDDSFWKFPGGRVENFDFENELNSLEEACKREVKEEMGIEIEIIKPLKPMLVKKDETTWVVLIHYLAKRVGEVKPGDDILKWDWIDIDNLPDDCAPNIRPVIESI
ncbi:NUDIX hydrolase [Candidatus Falkowbacteria bacterium]|jgi:ADP-ribose pyrophosphatase YjhB (NUDIX family)|nr:NUDIX hydrolase [Candidatus Falkowbacteria bacterium]MBT7007440.1 NUDIX hydrolase [Candidatus Falkowbacteria bacterium]